MADKYVVKQETDFWGNDKTVIKRETTAADVGAAAGTIIGMAVATNQRSKYNDAKKTVEQIDQMLSKGDYTSAYDQATALSNNSERYYRSAGLIFKARAARYLTKYEEALKDLDTALQLLPNSEASDAKDGIAMALFERGCVLLAKDDSPNAIREFTKVIQSNPAHYGALNGRGTALRKIGNYEQSIRDLSQAIQFEPGESDHYLERGLTYTELKDYEKALADFAQAASLAPASSAGYRNRGMIYALQGEHNKAISEYDRAIQVNSAYAPNFLARAKSYRAIGKEAEANRDESRAAQIEKQEKAFTAYLDSATAMYSEGFTKVYTEDDRHVSINFLKVIGYPILSIVGGFALGINFGEMCLSVSLLGGLLLAVYLLVNEILEPRRRRQGYEKYAARIADVEHSKPTFGHFYKLYLEARSKSEIGTLADKTRPLLAETSA